MVEIGSGSGVKIVEDGERLLVVDTRTASLAVVIFVLVLVTLFPGGAGIVLVSVGLSKGAFWAWALLPVGVAALAGALLVVTIRLHGRRKRAPLEQLVPLAVIDLTARTLCDGAGRSLAPLDSVRFHRAFQIGSSSPALAVSFGGQKLVLARANPFAGGLGTLEDALRAHGLVES